MKKLIPTTFMLVAAMTLLPVTKATAKAPTPVIEDVPRDFTLYQAHIPLAGTNYIFATFTMPGNDKMLCIQGSGNGAVNCYPKAEVQTATSPQEPQPLAQSKAPSP